MYFNRFDCLCASLISTLFCVYTSFKREKNVPFPKRDAHMMNNAERWIVSAICTDTNKATDHHLKKTNGKPMKRLPSTTSGSTTIITMIQRKNRWRNEKRSLKTSYCFFCISFTARPHKYLSKCFVHISTFRWSSQHPITACRQPIEIKHLEGKFGIRSKIIYVNYD